MKSLLRYDSQILTVSILFLLAFIFIGVPQWSLIIFMIAIIIFGIPHGALDHIIAFNGKRRSFKKVFFFYTKYIGLIVVVALCWYFAALPSFIIFLLISAHHFGQSQLFYIPIPQYWLKMTTYTTWGIFVLSLIIYINYGECLVIFQSLEWLNVSTWMSAAIWQWSTIISGALLAVTLTYFTLKNLITTQRLVFELGLLLVLFLFSAFTNAVITFSVYFGLWHSLRSLILEYESIKEALASYNLKQFINDLLPFTLLAVVFLAASFYFFATFEMSLSPYMIFIIIISTLTVPHLFVMSDLYESQNI